MGDTVVTSGNFLIEAETRLKTGIQQMVSAHRDGPDHGPLERLIAFSGRSWLLTLRLVVAAGV